MKTKKNATGERDGMSAGGRNIIEIVKEDIPSRMAEKRKEEGEM